MPKITLEDAVSGYRSNATVNANNDLIEEALNNGVLYRNNPTGEPNQMLNPLDMNSNAIINVGVSDASSSLVTRQDLADLIGNVAASPVLSDIADRQIYVDQTSDVTATLDYSYGYVRFVSVGPASFIVPSSGSYDFMLGTEIHVRQAGTGIISIVEDTGVTVNPPFGGSLVLAGQGATITVKKVGTDEWDLMGQVFAA